MGVLRALAAEIGKMFAADLWLTLAAVAAVTLTGVALGAGVIGRDVAPFTVTVGVLAALAVGVVRGARR
jgi:uncharacterized membrane protein